MKGAVDGGLDVPHNEKRFPGYIKEAKKYDPDALRDRITGGHIKEYMEYLEGASTSPRHLSPPPKFPQSHTYKHHFTHFPPRVQRKT